MTPAEILEILQLGDLPIVLLAACSALFAALFVYRTMLVHDPLQGRLATLVSHRDMLREASLGPQRRVKRERGMDTIRRVVSNLKLLRSREAEKATLKLLQAGFRSKDALIVYFFAKLAVPFVVGVGAVIALYVLDMTKLAGMMRLAAALAAVLIGAWAPDIYVRNVATKRRLALRKGVPDTLDLLVICAEAGQSLDGALSRVSGECGLFCPEMAEELTITSIELGLMPERRTALENLSRRTGVPELRSVINALIQTEKYGTPLAHALRVLASEYRQDRLMRAEEKAARLPAIMTVPMIIFILPPLFVVLLGPAILQVMDQFIRKF
jgi:tight adherence protein C